ncbi:MAG TPA: RNA methyltransferase [Oscillospiraceae bacterium]|nr:RNA methyltransferase [Oscillospiraceae bacterium]HPF56194.1 RNA methyltransferase [Clostridiales bacterium]HPK35989.1 RNA methyltransferase [Oscillospiraceae bacterium]HPR76725.1 RNA methyltransferase [Oscillospiraceae bacterium]
MIITSTKNDKIKFALTLKTDVKTRAQNGLCFTEGLRLCAEAVASNRAKTLFFTRDFSEKHPDFFLTEETVFERIEISDNVAKTLSDVQNPQGIFCLCDTNDLKRPTSQLSGGKILALEHIADPGNLGTILRTAEAFDANGILLSADCTDVFSPKVLRAGMGCSFRLPIYESADFPSDLKALSEKGFTVYGAMLSENAVAITKLSVPENFILVVGNEANGITPETAAVVTPVIIPMKGRAESLNAASAASILLWELFGK